MRTDIIFVLAITCLSSVTSILLDLPIDPNVNVAEIEKLAAMKTCDFVNYYGYPCETHTVVTEDGYMLQIHRVPFGKKSNTTEKRPSVYLQHGIMSQSSVWYTAGPFKAFAFILADNGYDVWTGNSRGNKYSRNHTTLDPDKDAGFWDFSWHEMGCYDIPAVIDYILDQKKEEKLFYIGHSQGTTIYYVMLSEKPEYGSKIHAQFSLAPVAYITNSKLEVLNKLEGVIELGIEWSGIHEITNTWTKFVTRKLCPIHYIDALCLAQVFSGNGFDYSQFNCSLIPIYLYDYPAGGSIKQLVHFMQDIKSGEFKQFDYGRIQNYLRYGTVTPPKYNLTNITPPIYLIYSLNDKVAIPKNVERLYFELPQGNKHIRLVEYKDWNHNDYTVGIDAKSYVYDYILDDMKQYISK